MQGIPRRPFVHVDSFLTHHHPFPPPIIPISLFTTSSCFSSSCQPRRWTGLESLGQYKKKRPCSTRLPQSKVSIYRTDGILRGQSSHTGRQALLQLLGLVGVLEHQGVQVLLAADLELDVVGLLVLLDPRGYNFRILLEFTIFHMIKTSLDVRGLVMRALWSTVGVKNTYRKRPSDGRSR